MTWKLQHFAPCVKWIIPIQSSICNWAVLNRPSDRAQLRQEPNLCRNQDHRSSSPVVGGMLTGHHSSSAHSGTLANADQATSGAPFLLATPQSMKKHDTIDRPLHGGINDARRDKDKQVLADFFWTHLSRHLATCGFFWPRPPHRAGTYLRPQSNPVPGLRSDHPRQ